MTATASSSTNRRALILHIDDDEADAFLTEKALRKGPVDFDLHVAESGPEAIAYLRDPANPYPDLILLDLDMPGMHGRDVLHWIKAHPIMRRIPVVILTGSEAESDILDSYDLHANAYMVKPGDPSIFEKVAGSLEDFWLLRARLAAMP